MRLFNKIKTLKTDYAGFTLVEILVSLGALSILLVVITTVVATSSSVNSRTNLNTDAGVAAFKKVQSYINTSYDSIPIGDDVSGYEVEDFSGDTELEHLKNVEAKVYVEPASVVNSGTTTETNNFSETSTANTAYSSGSEISASGMYDPTNCCRREWRLSDNNDYNLVYNNFDSGSSNQEMPAIDLGSSQSVDTIRINWYSSYYTSQNFRIEGSNNGTNWTTVSDGLSTTVSVGTSQGDYPEDYPVNGTYRYWRMFNVTGTNSSWIALSEIEAFAAASGDVVEQSSSGGLNFSSSDIDLTESSGQQSVGIRFNNINVDQGVTIDNAYIQFTASGNDSGAVTLLATGVDTDNATGWSGSYAVDNAVSGSNGTTAVTTWSPNAWSSGNSGVNQQLPVTSIVQEILSRGGWSKGNSMAFAIQYGSGGGKREADKNPAPELVIEWSETATVTTGGQYVDLDGDGDADNPTLLKVTAVIEYDAFGERKTVEYSSYIRKYGIGG